MAEARITTRRASTPKPPPGSAESIRRQVAHLEAATKLLRAAEVVERDPVVPHTPSEANDLRVGNALDALLNLEAPIRDVRYMASIANLLITEHVHRRSDGMFELSDHEISRLVFATGRAAEMAIKLDEQFEAAFAGRPA